MILGIAEPVKFIVIMLKHLDLFSGIGGFSLGLEATGGFETAAFCDIDLYSRKVLKKHWPHVKQYEDIKGLNYERLKADGLFPIDIITGLLEKMLVDTLNSVSTPYSRTWKVKTTPQGRLVFQLLASVPNTKEKESGLWRTPDAYSGGSNLNKIKEALAEGHLKRKSGHTIQIRLADQVREPRLWPTPTEGGRKKTTGQLNPTWVEWLMGYPTGWTDLSVSETVSSHKSPTISEQ